MVDKGIFLDILRSTSYYYFFYPKLVFIKFEDVTLNEIDSRNHVESKTSKQDN